MGNPRTAIRGLGTYMVLFDRRRLPFVPKLNHIALPVYSRMGDVGHNLFDTERKLDGLP
ncbi:hypothetical protein FA13DRAFT_1730567 [Coprinellus micaceus]|uniref:Uncharacterized protein n=1 Tax=Coprinellus micaceus TaxID=71717 RepID=A0A4Y7THY1_COPMI|nr:hypothetical protein FA13DRAFT_1730567 [Coprinellus micaceus]